MSDETTTNIPEEDFSTENKILGGAKRKNGHKSMCGCHICDNMRNKAKRGGYKKEARSKIEGASKKKNGHSDMCTCPICKNMKNARKINAHKNKYGGDNTPIDDAIPADDDTDSDTDSDDVLQNAGGRKSRKSRKGNGHKPGCGCPICKNMRKKSHRGGSDSADRAEEQVNRTIGGRKTRKRKGKTIRRHKKRTHKRR